MLVCKEQWKDILQHKFVLVRDEKAELFYNAHVAQHKLHPIASLSRFREFLTLSCFPPWLLWVLEALDTDNSHTSCSTKWLWVTQVGRKAGGEGIKVLSKVWNMGASNCAGSKKRVDCRKEEGLDLAWF